MANEPVCLEAKLLKLKQLKVWGIIITAVIIVLFASILVAYSNFSFKLPEAKAETNNRQAEINKNIGTETASLEFEKLELERFKVWEKIITVAITVLFGTVLGVLINYSFQKRQLKQQKLLNDAQIKQSEMEYLGKFLTYALEEDINKRVRFADYFAKLTISVDVQKRWMEYYQGLVDLKENKEKLEDQSKTAKNEEEKQEIERQLARVKTQTDPLPEKSDAYLTYEKAQRFLLDKDWKPKNYTKNEFEVQKDGNVIYDKATGLMWQKSGSEKDMAYDEARNYISQLNKERFAGYNDWRLPALKEVMTLLKPANTNKDLFIDQLFDDKQKWIWTSDLYSASSAWVVGFGYGGCYHFDFNSNVIYVRAVR